MKTYFTYILASQKNGTLYVGVTSDLVGRVYQHRMGVEEGFTKKYGLKRLVYYEETSEVEVAIQREKQLKNWKREWKVQLIEKNNPDWNDLYEGIMRS